MVDVDPRFLAKLQQTAEYGAGLARKLEGENAALKAQFAGVAADLNGLRQVLAKTQVMGAGNPDIQRVENIPGQRIPFDMAVDIPIGPNTAAMQSGTITIPQNGPFVAVARYATFQSNYQFQQLSSEGTTTTFNGRSFGRYRPIHSAWDLNDGQFLTETTQAVAFPGSGAPYIASPSNASSFRTMQGDYRIKFEDAGSSLPRSNIDVPSSLWVKAINNPFELGALDFFERGSVLTFKVTPQHVNNPGYGNVSGFAAGNALYPFIQSQFDTIEGVADPIVIDATTDPITRAPQGILTIGFHGYIIIQPAGAGYT